MNKIPSSKDFIDKFYPNHFVNRTAAEVFMVEFATLHVQAALKKAANNAETTVDSAWNRIVDEDSILNSYPLTNIK